MIKLRPAYPNELYHHGIKGQKWGVRRFQNKDGSLTKAGKERYNKSNVLTPNKLSKHMQSFTYSDFKGLKSPAQVEKDKSGDCHSQVMYEMDQLKRMGINAKAKFFIEYDSKTGQGGTTHSFVYYKDGKDTIWFENAWGSQAGQHRYKNEKDMIADIEKRHRAENGKNTYDSIAWGTFNPEEHTPGETLQQLVDICLKG